MKERRAEDNANKKRWEVRCCFILGSSYSLRFFPFHSPPGHETMMLLVNPHFRVMNNQDLFHTVQFGPYSGVGDLNYLGSKDTSIKERDFFLD